MNNQDLLIKEQRRELRLQRLMRTESLYRRIQFTLCGIIPVYIQENLDYHDYEFDVLQGKG